MSKLVKNTAIYAMGDILPRLLSFISFPILTSYLSPAEYGIINYVNTINLFLTAIGLLCLNTYYLVFYYKQDNEKQQKKMLGNLTLFIITFNLIFSGFLFLFGNKFFKLLGGNIDFYPYIAIGIVTCFFNIFSVLPTALFRLKENALPLTLINIAKGVLTLALTLILVIFFDFKATGVLYSGLVIAFMFAGIFFYITYKNMIFNINWNQIKVALIFSLPLLPGSLSYFLITMSDRILIDKYLNLTSLGIYSTASTLALLLNIISSGAYKAFEPYFFKIYGSVNFTKEFTTVRNVFFAVLVLCASALALFSKEFFLIFTNQQYYNSYLYVPLILVGVIASSLSLLYGTIVTARGKTKINSMITIIGGTISITLNILLLPKLGLFGACVSSSITMFLVLTANVCFSRIKNIQLFKLFLLFLTAAVIVVIGVYYLQISNMILSIFIKIILLLTLVFTMKVGLKIQLSFFKKNNKIDDIK